MTFDSVATTYDATFGLSPIARLFRFRLSERLQETVKAPARILDLGCGTGEDAVWLAAQGYEVDAIDSSSRMIEVAREKALRVRSPARFECRSIQDLANQDRRYDAVVSNFGALNCVPLEIWTRVIPALLAPAGRAFLVLMGRRPLPESLRKGFANTDRGERAEVRLGESTLQTEYPSVSDVTTGLGSVARVARQEALGCLVPGPGYARFARLHPGVVGLLAMMEPLVRRAPFFADRGDHTLLEVRLA